MSSRKGPTAKVLKNSKSKTRKLPALTNKPRVGLSSSNMPSDRSRMGISSVPLGSGPTRTNISSGRDSRLGEWYRVIGSEFIGTINQPALCAPGTVLFSRSNDVAPPNTRLAQLSALYERWEPLKYEYVFEPSVGSSTAGSLMAAIDPDPCRIYADDPTTLVSLRVLRGSCLEQVWRPFKTFLPSERDYTTLWCDPATTTIGDPEDRLSTAGCLWIVSSVPTGASAQVLGQIELRYDIKFYLPRLKSNAANSSFDGKFRIGNGTGQFFEGVPTATNIPLLATILSKTKSIYAGAVTASSIASEFEKILRLFKPWAATIPACKQIMKDDIESNAVAVDVGLPHGYYRVDYTFCGTSVPSTGFITAPQYGANSAVTAGQQALAGGNTQEYIGFDGVSYPVSRSFNLEFIVKEGGPMGFVDTPCQWTTNFPTAVYMFFRISWYSSASYQVLGGLTFDSDLSKMLPKRCTQNFEAIYPFLSGYGSVANGHKKALMMLRSRSSEEEHKGKFDPDLVTATKPSLRSERTHSTDMENGYETVLSTVDRLSSPAVHLTRTTALGRPLR